jgi:mycothiol system anti-sigma-R factor
MSWEVPEGSNADDCGAAIHQLYHYLDGELTDQRREQIAEHLDLCGPCAGAAVFEAELRQVIANRCRDRVPDTLRIRIAALIEAERHQHGADPALGGTS